MCSNETFTKVSCKSVEFKDAIYIVGNKAYNWPVIDKRFYIGKVTGFENGKFIIKRKKVKHNGTAN